MRSSACLMAALSAYLAQPIMPAFATPFENELCTNYVPSAQDRQHISDLLVEPKERLTQLNDSIFKLEQALYTLKEERDILEDEIEQHTHLLTPIRTLPDDVLTEIFLACLPDTHNAVMSCSEAPLLLGLVCSHWRFLVYSTPSLWASLHIALPAFPFLTPSRSPETAKYLEICNARVEQHRAAVRDWLTRSGSCPLSISLQVPLDPWAAEYPQTISIRYLEIILCFSRRWHTLDMTILEGDISHKLASLPTTLVPILKDLHLKFSTGMRFGEMDDIEKWRTSGLLHAPQLRTLDISAIPFSPSSAPSISWSHLSSLNLKYIHLPSSSTHPHAFNTIQEIHTILNRCPRLVHCSFDITALDYSDETIPIGTISLPFLQTLTISESSSLSAIFECMSDLSALRGISYQTRILASYRQTSSLITLLARTNNQITYLSIDLQAFTLADLNAIFSLVPNLIHLVDSVPHNAKLPYGVHSSCLPQSFDLPRVTLELLAPLNTGEIYCPHLQILHLNKTNKLSDANMLSFLQRRLGASKCSNRDVHPLREFCTTFLRPMEMDIREQLLDYIDNGPLRLNIVYIPHRTGADNLQFNPNNGLVTRPVADIIRACQS